MSSSGRCWPWALAQQPRVLLLDEPTAALDLGHAQQVLDLVDRLRRQDDLTVISTLHDLTLASGRTPTGWPCCPRDGWSPRARPPRCSPPRRCSTHYGARAQVVSGPDGPAVLPVSPLTLRNRTTSPGRSCAAAGRSAVAHDGQPG